MLLLPMLLIVFYAFTDAGNEIMTFRFTLDNFIKFFTDPDFLLVLWRSIKIALKTTVICVLLGYPIAYFIAFSSDKMRNILILAITLPTWINMLGRTYAWIGILSKGGIVSEQKVYKWIDSATGKIKYTVDTTYGTEETGYSTVGFEYLQD